MGHLSERDLNALIDHRLAGEPLWRAQQHLESCASCRDAFADLSGRQEALERALDHDPGDAYFAGFADRVVDRIVAEEATGADFSPLRDQALQDPIRVSWWQRPQAIAAAGSLVALIAGAGVVLMLAPQRPVPGTQKEREAAMRALNSTSAAESGAVAPVEGAERQKAATSEADRALKQETPPPTPRAEAPPAAALNERAQPSSRMVPVRRDQTGEEVAAPASPSPVFAPPPAPESKGTSVLDLKRRAAEPAQLQAGESADKEKLAKTAAPPRAPSAAPQAFSAPSAPSARDEAGAHKSTATGTAANRDQSAERRVCGTVRDDTGRALRGVSVTAADVGRTAISDAVGRFCFYLPAGPHTLELLAVGFKPVWLQVPASGGGDLSAIMLAVSVLDGGATAAGRSAASNVAEKEGAKAQSHGPVQFDDRSFFSLSDSTKTWIQTAEHLQVVAVSGGTANTWDSAALAWERLLPATEGTAAESEIRSRLAECRFHAWELGPTDKREDQAISALTSYLVRAPAGPKRDEAAKLLDRIRNH